MSWKCNAECVCVCVCVRVCTSSTLSWVATAVTHLCLFAFLSSAVEQLFPLGRGLHYPRVFAASAFLAHEEKQDPSKVRLQCTDRNLGILVMVRHTVGVSTVGTVLL